MMKNKGKRFSKIVKVLFTAAAVLSTTVVAPLTAPLTVNAQENFQISGAVVNTSDDSDELVGAASDELIDLKVTGKQYYEVAYEILKIVNEERAKVGEAPLIMDKELLEIAGQRSAELSIAYLSNHYRPNGTLYSTAYPVLKGAWGENIQWRYPASNLSAQNIAEAAMTAWMNSTGHRENILRSNFESIGIGVFINNDSIWLTQNFGTKARYGNEVTKIADSEVKTYSVEANSSYINLISLGENMTSSFRVGAQVKLIPLARQSFNYRTYYTLIEKDNVECDSNAPEYFTVDNWVLTAKKEKDACECWTTAIARNGDENAYASNYKILPAINPNDHYPNAREVKLGESATVYGKMSMPSDTGVKKETNRFAYFTTEEAGEYHIIFAPMKGADCPISMYVNNLSIMDQYGVTPDKTERRDTYSIDFTCSLAANTRYYFSMGSISDNFIVMVTKDVAGKMLEEAPVIEMEEYTISTPDPDIRFKNLDHSYSFVNNSDVTSQYVILKPKTTGYYEFAMDANFFSNTYADIVPWDGVSEVEWFLPLASTTSRTDAVRVYLDKDKTYALRYTSRARYGSVLGMGLVELPKQPDPAPTPEPGDGNPDDGKPDDGNVDDGKPDDGNTDNGKPDEGNPDDWKPDDGKPDEGNPDDGKPDDGKPDDGKPDEGNPDNGNQVDKLDFKDVPENAWYTEGVKFVNSRGIMTGYQGARAGEFGPKDNLTRAQFATMIHRMAGEPETTYVALFPDVPAGKFYSIGVTWCAQNKIITGYTSGDRSGQFGSREDDLIERQQVAAILYRYAKDVDHKDVSARASYADANIIDGATVSSYATDAMQWCVAMGIITGKDQKNGTYLVDPKGKATRAEAATMIVRYMNNVRTF